MMRPFALLFFAGLLACLAFQVVQVAAGPDRASIAVVNVTSTSSDVTVVGTTATQAVLAYNAPDSRPCRVEVSESKSLSPLVQDVDGVLFPGSDLDSRPGALSGGTARIFVVGARTAEQAPDARLYSRALQAFTQHYFRIGCSGGFVLNGSFRTGNIPLGMTWNDTLPVDPSRPGSYAWPSLSASDGSEKIVDPQTGLGVRRLTTLGDPWMYGAQPAQQPDICAPGKVANESGELGYHCMYRETLSWVNASSGEVRRLGYVMTGWRNAPDGWENAQCDGSGLFVPGDPNSFFCMSTAYGQPSTYVLLKGTYRGSNQYSASQQAMPDCLNSSAPCIAWTNLTPQSQGNDLASQWRRFDPTVFDAGYLPVAVMITAVQNGKLWGAAWAGQDTYAWLYAFDPTTNSIVASTNTYSKGRLRWCSLHSGDSAGNVDFARGSSNDLGFWGSMTSPNGARTGPFVATTLSPLPATPGPCPANMPFGVAGNNCSTVTVDGQPCVLFPSASNAEPVNPNKCGSATAGYLQDAQVGDQFLMRNPAQAGQWEHVRLLNRSDAGGTKENWVIERDSYEARDPGRYASWNAGSYMLEECAVFDRPAVGHPGANGWVWQYLLDPHGNNILWDQWDSGLHSTYRPFTLIMAANLADGSLGYRIRKGDVPAVFNDPGFAVPGNAAFAGVAGDDNFLVETHVTMPFDDQWALDAHPLEGGRQGGVTLFGPAANSGTTGTAPATLVAGQLYKYSTAAYGGAGSLALHPKQRSTAAFCGTHVLLDASGPRSTISSDATDSYKYCIAKQGGECRPDSAAGDAFINCPDVQIQGCVFPGYGQNGYNIKDICIGDTGSATAAITQLPITQGAGFGRVLTHGFTQYRAMPTFWNARWLPEASFFLFSAPDYPEYGNAQNQTFIAALPPFPQSDGIDRSTFISTAIPVQARPGAVAATIRFGYAEYGQASDYRCTSRKEVCRVGQAADYRAFAFDSDPVAPVPCAGGCTITIPTLPQHVTYYDIEFRDASGNVVAEQPGVAVELASVSAAR